MTHNILSSWKPFPRASVEGWILHSFGRGELSNEVILNEELDDLLAQAHGCEGTYGRSLPLDLEGDILKGLLGHPVTLMGCVLRLRRTSRLQSDRLPE